MAIDIVDNSIKFEVFADPDDPEFDDDICFRFTETCPEEEKVFYGGETNLYVTRAQAKQIAEEILKAIAE